MCATSSERNRQLGMRHHQGTKLAAGGAAPSRDEIVRWGYGIRKGRNWQLEVRHPQRTKSPGGSAVPPRNEIGNWGCGIPKERNRRLGMRHPQESKLAAGDAALPRGEISSWGAAPLREERWKRDPYIRTNRKFCIRASVVPIGDRLRLHFSCICFD